MRVLVLARRMPGKGNRALLTGTLVAETVGETLLGLGLLALAVGDRRRRRAPRRARSVALYALAAVAALTGIVLIGRRHAKVKRFVVNVKAGCAMVKCPRTYARHVLPWQLAQPRRADRSRSAASWPRSICPRRSPPCCW